MWLLPTNRSAISLTPSPSLPPSPYPPTSTPSIQILGRRLTRRTILFGTLVSLLTLALVLRTSTAGKSVAERGRGSSVFISKGVKKEAGGARSWETDPKRVDEELLELLVKTKRAMEEVTPIEDIASYADRFIVLNSLSTYADSLPLFYPRLNSTKLQTYQRTLAYHHEQLFAKLFPYISRSESSPRPLKQLIKRYEREEGIVIPCGRDQFQYAVHLVATLKHVHRTTLPIQVVYAGNDDLPSDRRAALRSIATDVETVDLLHFFDEDHVGLQGGGWAIKAFAILASTFKKVIICDADAVFFRDPRELFDNPGFKETGTLFFRDREIFPGDGNVHDWWHSIMAGREPSAEMQKSRWWTDKASREEMESGVVVFDKGRKEVLMGLIYCGWLNTKAIREPVTYKYTYGDKESFFMAFELGQIPYHFDPPYASIIGQLTHPDTKHSISSRICSDHLFHLDYKGRPLWFNGSLFQEKRIKDKGFFLATHWAYGTVEWACEFEPWCMVGIREQDVFKLTDDETSVLTHMIGAALFWENKFPGLIDKHY